MERSLKYQTTHMSCVGALQVGSGGRAARLGQRGAACQVALGASAAGHEELGVGGLACVL